MTENSARSRAIADEQAFVDVAYAALDRQREGYASRLSTVRTQQGMESAGALSERDSFATHYEDNILRLRNVENRLVMGRLDFTSGRTEHIGRIGLRGDDQEILLLDWRAPQAEAFYQATAANPVGVLRRRHIQTRLREVTGVEDELLDTSGGERMSDLNLTGEGALMAAMSAARDGKMSDIVATIQAEQDSIIRANSNGILVVQGGPGTGKTAVALHRAAYLLYSQRERLSRSGVLVIGPSPVFLRYIDQVLPSLGESDIVSATMATLLPGIRATATDEPRVAQIKGRAVWRTIAKRAVKKILQRRLERPVSFEIDGSRVTLWPVDVERAQHKARRAGKTHNEARDTYAKYLVRALARQVAEDKDLSLEESEWITADVAASVDARREINLRWMPSSAIQLLERLYARPELLAQCAPELTPEERKLLLRPKGSEVTESDIPILDELAELLGTFHTDAEKHRNAAAKAQQNQLNSYVKETMEAMNLGGGIVDAETLAGRVGQNSSASSLAERASDDRTWTYGHIVVDEAQELTPMQWEMLVRRCPTRSMTVVGDLDQRPEGSPTDGWKHVLGRIGSSANEQRLTVSYRTPATILDAAGRVMDACGTPVRSVKAARDLPGSLTISDTRSTEDQVLAQVDSWARTFEAEGGGNLAVIVADDTLEEVSELLASRSPWDVAANGGDITSPFNVLTATQSKGLEFDVVILVDPMRIYEEGPGNLYVAMTRPTRHLHVVSNGRLPGGL